MATSDKAWDFLTTALWVMGALVLKDYLFPKFEHFVLDGTTVGRTIGSHLALGTLNIALVWLVPILLLLAAVRMKRIPVQGYFAWVAPRAVDVFLALVGGAALQLADDAIPYLAGADMTSTAIAQYRSAQSAGDPVWLPLFDVWPSFIAAPLVEESIFRGFLWRGWEASRLERNRSGSSHFAGYVSNARTIKRISARCSLPAIFGT